MITRSVREVEHGNTVDVYGLCIGGGVYKLSITQLKEGQLNMLFTAQNDAVFAIQFRNDGMSFTRDVVRPNHDHDDTETLVENKTGKVGWGSWNSGALFCVEFGPVAVDY